jgi:glycosyltransferase involved in cell wall biosynthesis
MIPLAAFPAGRPGRIRCVTTIHDLIPLLFPEYAPRSKKRRLFPIYRLLMREIGRRSDVIITDSQCSRTDVIAHLHIPADRSDKVLAIPVGVSPAFTPEKGEASEKASKTVLWVGRTDPYKNLAGLVQAFAIVRKTAPFPVRLRIAGSRDPRYPEASQLAEALNITPDIDWLGYVSDEQLVDEYRKADVFVLPSRYEGFGLPVVEAMACGTPVICGNGGSLPEVAGDAAMQVHPDDIEGMAEAIRRVLSDPALAAGMVGRGLRRAAVYTWAETARLTLLAYNKALE